MWRARLGLWLTSLVWFGMVLLLAAKPALAEADVVDATAAPINEKYNVDIKKIFATTCGLCHGAYGTKQGDRGGGPKLAGTKKSTEQVVEQIKNGKSGYMPAFKTALKEEQIQALAEYIKALPAN